MITIQWYGLLVEENGDEVMEFEVVVSVALSVEEAREREREDLEAFWVLELGNLILVGKSVEGLSLFLRG